VRLIGRWYVCRAVPWVHLSASRAIDGCMSHHSTISSCQSAVTSKIVKRYCSRVFPCKQHYIKYPDLTLDDTEHEIARTLVYSYFIIMHLTNLEGAPEEPKSMPPDAFPGLQICQNCFCDWSSTPDTAGGAHGTPQTL